MYFTDNVYLYQNITFLVLKISSTIGNIFSKVINELKNENNEERYTFCNKSRNYDNVGGFLP